MNDLLKGAFDLHVHTSPDVSPRKCSDLELAGRWRAAGMKGGAVKCHYADTTGRAAILGEQFPDLSVAGGLVLNRQAGGLNPEAVLRTAQAGGKFLWFPTLDSMEYRKFLRSRTETAGKESGGDLSGFIAVCDEGGRLLPAVTEILDVVKQRGLILCTGHIGASEGLALIREASARGIEKMVVTHADSPATFFDSEQQRECVRLGAVIEHSYFTTCHGRTSWELLARQIREIGSGNIFLSTDSGQLDSPHSDEGMLLYAEGLQKQGITERELEQMMKENPAALLF